MIDPNTLKTTAAIDTEGAGHWVAVLLDGKYALISNHGDGTISVIDLAGKQVVTTFNAGWGIETLSFH